jgi:hypothetical protein
MGKIYNRAGWEIAGEKGKGNSLRSPSGFWPAQPDRVEIQFIEIWDTGRGPDLGYRCQGRWKGHNYSINLILSCLKDT